MPSRTLLITIVCGLAAVVALPTSMAAATPSLAGSWHLSLVPTTAPIPITIPGLVTFTTDGSAIETDGSELVPGPATTTGPVAISPAHGIWQISPAMVSYYLQWFSVGVNADGSLNSTFVTTATVAFPANSTSHDTFTGSYTTVESNASGISKTTSGTIKGTLIPHPKLP